MLKQWWLKWREPKPFNEGYLPEADGHRIYFAEYGKKGGKPVLLTHGGPGGQTHAGHAAVFDLKKYRVIMFDQRGCGKSLPAGKLENNTMEDTLWDMKRLYEHLQLKEKVILRGASWGSTVMLCFAEKYPELLQIDRSCLVNPENIVSFDARTRKLFLKDDIVLEVSRRNARNVRKALEKKKDVQ